MIFENSGIYLDKLKFVDKQSLWSLRLWVIFRLSNVENLELINKITIFAHENGTQRKLGKRI